MKGERGNESKGRKRWDGDDVRNRKLKALSVHVTAARTHANVMHCTLAHSQHVAYVRVHTVHT